MAKAQPQVASMQNSLGFDLNERTYLVRATSLADFDARATQVKNVSEATVAAYRSYVEYLIGTKAGSEGRSISGFKAWTQAGRPTVEQYIAAHPVQAENRGVTKATKSKGKGKAAGKPNRAAIAQAVSVLRAAGIEVPAA